MRARNQPQATHHHESTPCMPCQEWPLNPIHSPILRHPPTNLNILNRNDPGSVAPQTQGGDCDPPSAEEDASTSTEDAVEISGLRGGKEGVLIRKPQVPFSRMPRRHCSGDVLFLCPPHGSPIRPYRSGLEDSSIPALSLLKPPRCRIIKTSTGIGSRHP